MALRLRLLGMRTYRRTAFDLDWSLNSLYACHAGSYSVAVPSHAPARADAAMRHAVGHGIVQRADVRVCARALRLALASLVLVDGVL